MPSNPSMEEIAEVLTVDEIEKCILDTESINEKIWTRRAAISVHRALLDRLLAPTPSGDTASAGEAVAVKALEWEQHEFTDNPDYSIAKVQGWGEMGHKYQVGRDADGPGFKAFLAPIYGSWFWTSAGHETAEAAKAAAQADFEQRIRSALAPTPVGAPAHAVEEDDWDGLDCACGGGWKVGHAAGCPEATDPFAADAAVEPGEMLAALKECQHLIDIIEAQGRDVTPAPKRETDDDLSSRMEREEVFAAQVTRASAAIRAAISKAESHHD